MRYLLCTTGLVVAFLAGGAPLLCAGDVFDRHTSKWLRKGIAEQEPLASLALKDAGRLTTLSADISSPCIVIQSNDGNITKALVAWGYRRSDDGLIPVLLIERFVTYRSNRGDAAAAAGENVMLFPGFRFNFDIGQVVPAEQGGDVRFNPQGELHPIGSAKLYTLNGSQLPPSQKKPDTGKHDGVHSADFAGTWNISVDGRWDGELELTADDNRTLRGQYTSAKSKSTYRVTGRIAALPHHVKLVIHLDNAQQSIDAFLFTREKSVMAGYSTLAGRQFGFLGRREKPRSNSP